MIKEHIKMLDSKFILLFLVIAQNNSDFKDSAFRNSSSL